MIAGLAFERPDARGVRRARFVPRAGIPLTAACLVAAGIRETLRELVDERCAVALGEPAAVDAAAWGRLTHDAYCFLVRGRLTDVVMVVGRRDAAALVRRAFGEAEPDRPQPCSALELTALERIAAGCAAAVDPLCAQRRAGVERLAPAAVPPCSAYFDVRLAAPVPATLGIAVVRDLPDPGPGTTIAPGMLAGVTLTVRAELGSASMRAARLLRLRPGDVLRLDAQVGSLSALNVANQRIASGTCGVSGARHAFAIHHIEGREVQA